MLDEISNLRKQGSLLCGIDEVGRGPLAGPVVTCAIIMPEEKIEGVKDSKKLTEKKRNILYNEILEKAIAVGLGECDNTVIDEINIKQATLLAMKNAVENLSDRNGKKVIPDALLIDNEVIDTNIKQYSIVHGDDCIYEISCASIIAKVYRDKKMIEYSKIYNEYSFETNKGYGTKKHYEGLDKVGYCSIHRKTFIKKYLS